MTLLRYVVYSSLTEFSAVKLNVKQWTIPRILSITIRRFYRKLFHLRFPQ